MQKSPIDSADGRSQRTFEHTLRAVLVRHGAADTPDLERKIARCVAQIVAALAETSSDSTSLSPLDVVRIRAGKFAATLTPPAAFRDPARLLALRAELHTVALAFVGESGAEGTRFAPRQRK